MRQTARSNQRMSQDLKGNMCKGVAKGVRCPQGPEWCPQAYVSASQSPPGQHLRSLEAESHVERGYKEL